jgi:archaellum biogenesis ATPase FlaH/CheY-like chemotaxis protein
MAKILVVDDDRGRDVIDLVLVGEGYQVVGTGDGAAAHNLVAQEKPNLIVLTIEALNINGLVVLQGLKTDQETRGIPVIILNEEDKTQEAERAVRGGALDCLIKPWPPGWLEDRIRIALTRSGPVIPTGNDLIDRTILGGITLGNLTQVDGPAGSGKSVICQHLAYGALLVDQKVAYYVQGMTAGDLVDRMGTLGLDIAPSMEDGEFTIYSLDEFYGDESEASSALERLRKHMDAVFAHVDIGVLDGLTGLVNLAGAVSSAGFFTECRFFCSPKTAVIVSLDATTVDSATTAHLGELTGNHLSLHVGAFTDGAEEKAMNVLQVIKVKGTILRTSSIICFAVDPELARSMDMSLKVLPDVEW